MSQPVKFRISAEIDFEAEYFASTAEEVEGDLGALCKSPRYFHNYKVLVRKALPPL